MKKVLGIIGTVVIAVIILMLGLGLGFGIGAGKGAGDSGEEKPAQTQSAEEQKDVTNSDQVEEVTPEDLPDMITITIKEDTVYVEDKLIKDENELKEYLEEINTDNREYQLKEENAILDTYEWVTKVFDDLKIQLVPLAE